MSAGLNKSLNLATPYQVQGLNKQMRLSERQALRDSGYSSASIRRMRREEREQASKKADSDSKLKLKVACAELAHMEDADHNIQRRMGLIVGRIRIRDIERANRGEPVELDSKSVRSAQAELDAAEHRARCRARAESESVPGFGDFKVRR